MKCLASLVSRIALPALTCVSVAVPLIAAEPISPAKPAAPRVEAGQDVRLRGRVICLPEEMHRAHAAELPTRHDHVWGFKAEDGKCYSLLRGRYSEAIFLDPRLREKELVLKARLFPKTQILEVSSIRSVRNGVVHDLYYYCDICDIEGVSPEPCGCCQGPVEVIEKPLDTRP